MWGCGWGGVGALPSRVAQLAGGAVRGWWGCGGVCVCVCACVRACVRACAAWACTHPPVHPPPPSPCAQRV